MNDGKSLKNKIYNSLGECIIRGEYQPNDILTEKVLSEKFGCSKAPVREALVALCNEGILRNLPRYGYEVVRITREDIDEMLKYRQLLEGGLLQTSIHSIRDRQLAQLRALDERCREVGDILWNHWDNNTTFHLTLAGYAGNKYIEKQLGRVLSTLKYAYGQYHWDRWEERCSEDVKHYHQRLVDCIEARDLDGALDNLEKDLREFAC